MTRRRSRSAATLSGALALLALAGCGGGSKRSEPAPAPPPTTSAPASPSPAERLAALQTGVPNPELARSFDVILDAMQPKCRESREQIASDAWGSHTILLQDRRIRESPLTILRRVAAAVRRRPGRLRCQAVFAGYVAFRETGR